MSAGPYCTLKSYLASGKSWAMSMSLPPTTFHVRKTSSEGGRSRLGESLGGAVFCARNAPGARNTQAKRIIDRNPARMKRSFMNFSREDYHAAYDCAHTE